MQKEAWPSFPTYPLSYTRLCWYVLFSKILEDCSFLQSSRFCWSSESSRYWQLPCRSRVLDSRYLALLPHRPIVLLPHRSSHLLQRLTIHETMNKRCVTTVPGTEFQIQFGNQRFKYACGDRKIRFLFQDRRLHDIVESPFGCGFNSQLSNSSTIERNELVPAFQNMICFEPWTWKCSTYKSRKASKKAFS